MNGQCWNWKWYILPQDHRVSIIFLLQFNVLAFEILALRMYLAELIYFWSHRLLFRKRTSVGDVEMVPLGEWKNLSRSLRVLAVLSGVSVIQNFEDSTLWIWKEIAVLWILSFALVIWVDDDTEYLVWNRICCIFVHSEIWARLECSNNLWIFSSLPTVNV